MEINELLKNAMLNKDELRVYVLRMIKAKIIEAKTAKNAKPIDEVQILTKMSKEWSEEISLFKSNGRDTSELENKLNILLEYIPKEPTEKEVIDYLKSYTGTISMNNTKNIIVYVKAKYPSANNKIIVDYIRNNVNK